MSRSSMSNTGFNWGGVLHRIGMIVGTAAFFAPWLLIRGCNNRAREYNALEMVEDQVMGGFELDLWIAAP